jgi:hypothetical protein
VLFPCQLAPHVSQAGELNYLGVTALPLMDNRLAKCGDISSASEACPWLIQAFC